MEHPYYHELQFDNAKSMIRSKGLAVPHKKEGAYVECLDFAACNKKEWEKQEAILERLQFTKRQIEEARFFPISFDKTGDIVQWYGNGVENDDPAFYLSTAFSDIVMAFSVYSEDNTLVKSGYMKSFEFVGKDGRVYEEMLTGIPVSLIKRVGDRYRIGLPIYSANKMSSIYVESRQVVPFDAVHDDGQRITVLFDSTPIPCYTQTNTKILKKEYLIGKKIKSNLEYTRAGFVAAYANKHM